MRLFLLLFSASFLLNLSAQELKDAVFLPNIFSTEIHPPGEPLLPPVIELNSNQVLEIGFDDLNFDSKSYSYRVIHCTPDWQASDLNFMQYMNGFESFEILDFGFSNSATRPFTHYWFRFPNDMMKPLMGGNYLVQVFPTDQPEETVFQRRLLVVDPSLGINAMVRSASSTRQRLSHQEVVFDLNLEFLNIQDQHEDIFVAILQNDRWDNAIMDLKPRYAEANVLHYDHVNGDNAFPGGNQYRLLDLKSLMVMRDPVMAFQTIDGQFHARLRPELPRAQRAYSDLPDINGACIYHLQENYTQTMDEDYIQVHFLLDAGQRYPDGEVYLIGALSNGQLDDRFRLRFDEANNIYYLSVPMKQGLYNYMYGFKANGSNSADLSPIEGSHSETENKYTILVYVRGVGDIAHRLVGYTELNSRTDRDR